LGSFWTKSVWPVCQTGLIGFPCLREAKSNRSGLTGFRNRPDQFGLPAALSCVFPLLVCCGCWLCLAPRFSSTLVATWTWQEELAEVHEWNRVHRPNSWIEFLSAPIHFPPLWFAVSVLHYACMCSPQLKDNKKRQRKLRKRICYKCKQHGHFIDDCPQVTGVLPAPNRSDRFGKPVRPVLATMAPQEHIKRNQASIASHKTKKQKVSKNKCNASSSKTKNRICYNCRSKGHESNNCPNGNIPKSKLVDYAFSRLRDDKNGICATRVICSPQTSIKAIWIPKSLVTNPKGPNMVWVPKRAC
jgi:hypothetical protein